VTLSEPPGARRHFVLVAVGTAGDMHPFLALGRALLRRGHRVDLLGPVVHRHLAEQAGVPFHDLGTADEYFAVVNNPLIWHPRKGIALLLSSLRFGADDIEAFIGALPARHAVLVSHPLALPAVAMTRAANPALRVAAVYLAPSNLRTVHNPLTIGPLTVPRWMPAALRRRLWSAIDRYLIDPHVLPGLNALRRQRGLAPAVHFFPHLYSVADLSLALFPDWFAAPQPDWPAPLRSAPFPLYDPRRDDPLPAGLDDFLATGTAPLVFTPGTGNHHARAYFEHALLACQRLGRRAILLTGYRDQVPAVLPPGVLWLPYVPLAALLPRVAALVHHGGIGTTAEALRAGVPQLVVPLAYDQFDNGLRVRTLGAGNVLPAARLNGARLRRQLATLLNDTALRQRCAALAAGMAADNNDEALCAALETL
jgi:rhamnosyltransferase subunit B